MLEASSPCIRCALACAALSGTLAYASALYAAPPEQHHTVLATAEVAPFLLEGTTADNTDSISLGSRVAGAGVAYAYRVSNAPVLFGAGATFELRFTSGSAVRFLYVPATVTFDPPVSQVLRLLFRLNMGPELVWVPDMGVNGASRLALGLDLGLSFRVSPNVEILALGGGRVAPGRVELRNGSDLGRVSRRIAASWEGVRMSGDPSETDVARCVNCGAPIQSLAADSLCPYCGAHVHQVTAEEQNQAAARLLGTNDALCAPLPTALQATGAAT